MKKKEKNLEPKNGSKWFQNGSNAIKDDISASSFLVIFINKIIALVSKKPYNINVL